MWSRPGRGGRGSVQGRASPAPSRTKPREGERKAYARVRSAPGPGSARGLGPTSRTPATARSDPRPTRAAACPAVEAGARVGVTARRGPGRAGRHPSTPRLRRGPGRRAACPPRQVSPVMVDPQASRFWRFAVKSGLLDDEAVRGCWEKIPEEKRSADAVDRRLARQAVNAGLLTLWQAQQLLAGRATGFKIDRYLLLDLIGQGGMGRVYLAKDTRLGPAGRDEGPLPGADEQPAGDRPVPARGQGRGPAPAREPRADLRRGRVDGHPLPRDGVHRGQERRPAHRRAGVDRLARGRAARPAGRARAGARPAEGADPPRRQPGQHPRHPRRRRQAHRPRPGDRPGRRGERHPRRRHGRHVRLHLPRAGAALARGRHADRHLFARLHALPHALGPRAVPDARACRRSSTRTSSTTPSR